MTHVKICGLSDVDSVLAAIEADADFLGIIFAPSPRQVSRAKARLIVEAVHKLRNRPAVVGVFVNAAAKDINRIVDQCRLDYVQLSGNESWQYCREIKKLIVKAIHVRAGQQAEDIIAEIEKGYRLLGQDKLVCLLDTHSAEVYGGTGQIFDWRLAKAVSARFPVMVAGGLTPDNVGELVKEVQPWGVDVSSGVESEGRKDVAKIRDFIRAVRKAETGAAQSLKL